LYVTHIDTDIQSETADLQAVSHSKRIAQMASCTATVSRKTYAGKTYETVLTDSQRLL